MKPSRARAGGTGYAAVIVRLVICAVLAGMALQGEATTAHNANWSCYPQYWNRPPPDNHVIKFNQNTGASPSNYCATAQAGRATQYTYWTASLDWGDPDGWVWVYMRHEYNEDVQQQMDGPYCANSGTPPYCSWCGCTWKWWGYWWKTYSTGWKNQQTNTYSGGPYWHRQGWF